MSVYLRREVDTKESSLIRRSINKLSSWPKYLSSPDVSTLFFQFKNVLCKTFPLSLVYSFELNIAFALESILRSRVSCVLFILLLITVNE